MAGLSMCIKAAARDTGVPSSELHISFRNQHDFKLWRRVLVQDKLDAMAPGAEDKGVSRTSKEATRQPTGPIAALTRHDSRSGHLRQPPSPSPPPSKYESDVDITVRDPNPGSGAGDRGAGTPLVSWGGEGGSDDGDIESQVSRMSLSGADRSGSGAQRSGHIAEVSASGEWAPASTPPAAAPTPVGQSACPQSLDEKYENECSDDDQELLRLIEQAERTRERRGLAPGGHWYGNETPRVSRSASARIIDEGDDRSSGDESLEALVTRVHERKRRDRIARQHAIAGSVLRSMLLIAKDDLPAASTARETVSRPWLGEGERVVWAYCEGLNGEEIAVTNQRIVKAMLEDGSVLDEAELWDVTAVDHVKGAFLLKTESITVRYGSRKPVSIAVRSRVCCTYLVRLLEPVCAPLPSQDTQGPGSGTPTSPRYSPPSPPTAAKRPDERKGASTAEAVVRDPGTSIPFNMAECRISQVENQAYTHPLVRKAHLPITHSGVLVRTSRGEQLVGETVVDTIAFNGKPYVAMREYNQEYNTTNWDDDAQTAFFRRRGHYDACEKAWRHTQIDPSTRAPVSFRVGSLCPSSPTEAKLLHQQWVEKVRKSMESLNRGKFGHFNRNCQHAAAYAVNTLAGMQEGRWAEPPNALFRMFGNGSWIPGIEERELGSHADLQGLAMTSDAPGSPRDFSVLSIHSGRSSPHPAPLVDPPTRRRTLSHLAALPPPMAGPSTTAAPARPPPKKAALSKEPGVGAVAAETPPDADTPHAYTIHVPSAIIDRKDQVVFYVVRVTSNPHLTKDMPKGGYSLHKRYRDFENFHRRLRAEYRTRFPSGAKASPRHGVFPVLPKKNILRFTSHRDKAFVHGRRTKLQVYIHALLNTPGIPDSEEFRVFFDWPAPGRVVELTALNRKYALDQYPIVFLAYYNSSKKSRRLLKAFKSAARALRGRVLFARLHVDMEPELLASRSLNIKDLDRVPCVRVILRGQGHVPLEDAQCNEQKLTELARAYYKPVSARWRGALGKTLSSVGLSSTPERIGRIIEEYCAVAWRDGVECAAPLAEATADAPRYFFKLVGILGPPERETPRAHKYKNAFSDFVCSLVQKSE